MYGEWPYMTTNLHHHDNNKHNETLKTMKNGQKSKIQRKDNHYKNDDKTKVTSNSSMTIFFPLATLYLYKSVLEEP